MTLQESLFDTSIVPCPTVGNTPAVEIKLRDYQIEAINKIQEAWYGDGDDSTQIVMATGTGKTETFTGLLASELKHGRLDRALIVSHRKELVEQPRDRIKRNWAGALPVPGIVMGSHDECSGQIISATVQTLQSERRLARVMQYGDFSHIIIDECHHAHEDAATYVRLIEKIRESNPSVKVLGVTATPTGGNGIFKSTAYKVTIRHAVRVLKCLVEPVGLGVHLNLDLSRIKIRGGDFAEGQLADAMEASNCEAVVYKAWKDHAGGRPTMCFAVSVAHAETLSRYFEAKGVSVGFAHGGTAKDERERIVEQYKDGTIQVLFNCAVWTEGFDAPRTSAILMVRPTLSTTFYMQAVGRGLRPAEGKTDCLIFDFKPTGSVRSLISAGDIIGRKRPPAKLLEKAMDSGVLTSVESLDQGEFGIDEEPGNILIRVLDLLANKSKHKWTFDGVVASCNVNTESSIAIVHPQPDRIAKAEELRQSGNWSNSHQLLFEKISRYGVYLIGKRGAATEMFASCEHDSAYEIAEDYISENSEFAGKSATWRSRPPSDKLSSFAAQLGVFEPGLNAGELSQRITHKLCRDKLMRGNVIK